MPNLKEKKEALESAQKENLTAQKDVEENTRNIQNGKQKRRKQTLPSKRHRKRLPSRNRFFTKQRKPQNRLGRRKEIRLPDRT